ncbi:MAG: hypothetical protein H0T73_22625 [Ardenticatenales bacterium]|nr:hypothetical protein [Ardenticatenales bacterium]
MPSERMNERLQRLAAYLGGHPQGDRRDQLLKQEVLAILKHLPRESAVDQEVILEQIRAYGLGQMLE